jgi:hypothetical protein
VSGRVCVLSAFTAYIDIVGQCLQTVNPLPGIFLDWTMAPPGNSAIRPHRTRAQHHHQDREEHTAAHRSTSSTRAPKAESGAGATSRAGARARRSPATHDAAQGERGRRNGTERVGQEESEDTRPKDWPLHSTTTARAPTHTRLPHRGGSDTERARSERGKRRGTIPEPGAGGRVRVGATPPRVAQSRGGCRRVGHPLA